MNQANLFTALIIGVSFLSSLPSAWAQNYNYSYGDSRVVVQTQNGLAQPSSSYIGPGTLSKSAQGVIQSGARVNPGLPRVNQGSFEGTPGDNMYSDHPIHSVEPKPMPKYRLLQPTYVAPKQNGYTYIPGQNLPAEYSGDGAPVQVQIDKSGAASYSPSTTGTNSKSSNRRY